MIETNIRIVQPGCDLALEARRLRASIENPHPDQLERVCNNLRSQGIPAVVNKQSGSLLAIAPHRISTFSVTDPEWSVEVEDENQLEKLEFRNYEKRLLLAQLFERWLTIETRKRTEFWKIDSPRIFYQGRPFDQEDDIEVYRRFELSSIPIDFAGIGLIVEVSTAFFTSKTLAEYFRNDLDVGEKERLRKRFESLARRQSERKGTLMYDTGRARTKCYFDRMVDQPAGIAKTTVDGHTYGSLVEYYAERHKALKVQENDLVALVSFPGIEHSKPVVAKFLKLRVSNEQTPRRLKNLDKIDPSDRAKLVSGFWQTIGTDIFSETGMSVAKDPWCPPPDHTQVCRPPDLQFGNNLVLSSPKSQDQKVYSDYFRKKLPSLESSGCAIVPPAMPRTIQIAVPSDLRDDIVDHLSREIGDYIATLTRKPVVAETIAYSNINNAITQLQAMQPGLVLFVFKDNNPADYFNISFGLNKWRVHRITVDVLRSKFDKSLSELHSEAKAEKNLSRVSRTWKSFIQLNALDLIQHLDCVPWIIVNKLGYQIYVAIDVSKDGRYVGYSIFLNDSESQKCPFYMHTEVDVKADPKAETINDILLKEKLVQLLAKLGDLKGLAPVNSILFIRDGSFRGKEKEGISQAIQELNSLHIVSEDALIHFLNLHKRSVKGIRMWERTPTGQIDHLIEGTFMLLDDKTVVLTNTGKATLHQGTSEPILLVAQSEGMNISAIAKDMHSTSHLNFSSPAVAHRLPIFAKRTDDELQNRESQEIRRLK
jgi:hypothetical protein